MPAFTTVQTNEMNGIAQVGDYATPGTDALKVQALIDLLQPEATMTNRGHLDQMSPVARIQLFKELVALKAAVT